MTEASCVESRRRQVVLFFSKTCELSLRTTQTYFQCVKVGFPLGIKRLASKTNHLHLAPWHLKLHCHSPSYACMSVHKDNLTHTLPQIAVLDQALIYLLVVQENSTKFCIHAEAT